MIKEDILCFIWRYQLFCSRDLQTLSGKKLTVICPGLPNQHAGPDFENARIRIDGIQWSGSVEIHRYSSDWISHRHQFDPAYNNVILHVVYTYDREISLHDKTVPETCVLSNIIDKEFLKTYNAMVAAKCVIPCNDNFHRVNQHKVNFWLGRMLVERFEQKSVSILNLLKECSGDWNSVIYLQLARSFGFKTNANAFEDMAKTIPYQVIIKNKHQPNMLNALIFGQAGMLTGVDFQDNYPINLTKDYKYLQRKYKLKPIKRHQWKFFRMRPKNFPTIRLAQFATLCLNLDRILQLALEKTDLAEFLKIFRQVEINEYWKDHYRFDELSTTKNVQIGDESISNIILNTIAVILFSYGKFLDKEMYICNAISLLEKLPKEVNSITKAYESLGFNAKSAADSQALLHLKYNYCDLKKCLSCGIGLQVLEKNKTL